MVFNLRCTFMCVYPTHTPNAHKAVSTVDTYRYMPNAGVSAIAIAAGGRHTCALVTGGSLLCWGFNLNGQLGIGSTEDRNSPVAVSLGSGAYIHAAKRTWDA
jgi:alpha-tubulin suppressor-like RCC1 family protein